MTDTFIVVCMGSRVPVLPVRTSGRRVQNSTRKPEVADDIMYSARVQNSCNTPHVDPVCKGRVALRCYHGNITRQDTRATRGKLLEENATRLSATSPEENATRLSPTYILHCDRLRNIETEKH